MAEPFEYRAVAESPAICWAKLSDTTAVGRARQREIALEERCRSFAEVERGLAVEAAVAEARRCLRCDLERRER
jgi:hypothetical protein